MINYQLEPNRCQWTMAADGSYVRSNSSVSCQQRMIEAAENAHLQRQRRRRGFARRNLKV
jgi:hypothetical protein